MSSEKWWKFMLLVTLRLNSSTMESQITHATDTHVSVFQEIYE